jgi:hypothetical protein
MDMLELLNLRPEVSKGSEERARQSIDDCSTRRREVKAELDREINRLGSLSSLEEDRDLGLVLLARSEQIRKVSALRSSWCKASTAYDEALLRLDRLIYMRRMYVELVDDAHTR